MDFRASCAQQFSSVTRLSLIVLHSLICVLVVGYDGTIVTMHAAEEWSCVQFMIAPFVHARIVTELSSAKLPCRAFACFSVRILDVAPLHAPS